MTVLFSSRSLPILALGFSNRVRTVLSHSHASCGWSNQCHIEGRVGLSTTSHAQDTVSIIGKSIHSGRGCAHMRNNHLRQRITGPVRRAGRRGAKSLRGT